MIAAELAKYSASDVGTAAADGYCLVHHKKTQYDISASFRFHDFYSKSPYRDTLSCIVFRRMHNHGGEGCVTRHIEISRIPHEEASSGANIK